MPRKKPEATARDVAKAATGTADPRETHPRKYIDGCKIFCSFVCNMEGK
jgi:hypothetical protein